MDSDVCIVAYKQVLSIQRASIPWHLVSCFQEAQPTRLMWPLANPYNSYAQITTKLQLLHAILYLISL